jgi:PP-loop superfamily ATP-utilizing enzyme
MRARIEVEPQWIAWLDERRTAVIARLTALGFAAVELDPRGYRRGSLLPARQRPG